MAEILKGENKICSRKHAKNLFKADIPNFSTFTLKYIKASCFKATNSENYSVNNTEKDRARILILDHVLPCFCLCGVSVC